MLKVGTEIIIKNDFNTSTDIICRETPTLLVTQRGYKIKKDTGKLYGNKKED